MLKKRVSELKWKHYRAIAVGVATLLLISYAISVWIGAGLEQYQPVLFMDWVHTLTVREAIGIAFIAWVLCSRW